MDQLSKRFKQQKYEKIKDTEDKMADQLTEDLHKLNMLKGILEEE